MIDNGLKKKKDEIQTMKNYCFKNERNSTTCDHTNESRGPCAKWDKPNTG